MEYESTVTFESQRFRGVTYSIRRMSFGRRLDLTRQVRDLARRADFLRAGGNPVDLIESAVLAAEVDRVYLRWGLVSVDGLGLDGAPATAEGVIESGPEDLCGEILASLKTECHLSEEERKN